MTIWKLDFRSNQSYVKWNSGNIQALQFHLSCKNNRLWGIHELRFRYKESSSTLKILSGATFTWNSSFSLLLNPLFHICSDARVDFRFTIAVVNVQGSGPSQLCTIVQPVGIGSRRKLCLWRSSVYNSSQNNCYITRFPWKLMLYGSVLLSSSLFLFVFAWVKELAFREIDFRLFQTCRHHIILRYRVKDLLFTIHQFSRLVSLFTSPIQGRSKWTSEMIPRLVRRVWSPLAQPWSENRVTSISLVSNPTFLRSVPLRLSSFPVTSRVQTSLSYPIPTVSE